MSPQSEPAPASTPVPEATTAKGIRHALCSYWLIHTLLGSLSLLMTLPMLWTGFLPHSVVEICGYVLLGSVGISILWLIVSLIITALKIRNMELFARLFSFISVWACFLGLFSIFAYVAELDEVHIAQAHTTKQAIPVHMPEERLMGDSALQLYYHLEDSDEDETINIENTPSLTLLSTEHPLLLHQYIERSPRWKHPMSDQFYAELGHVVLTDADDPTGSQGSVHASFRRLIEGENIPSGYSTAKPGDPYPKYDARESGSKNDIPDIALDLGGDYILLLAWRGRKEDRPHAYQAMNAAIRAINEQFERLSKQVTANGKTAPSHSSVSHRGTEPEIRLNSPPSQYGCYQAEIYANPNQNGFLSLIVKDVESGKELRTIGFRSLYSFDDQELFRHEIPQSLPIWMRKDEWIPSSDPEKKDIPLFTIEASDELRSFLVDFELWFSPYGSQQEPRLLTTKRYRIQSFQPRLLKPELIMEKISTDEPEPSTANKLATPPATKASSI